MQSANPFFSFVIFTSAKKIPSFDFTNFFSFCLSQDGNKRRCVSKWYFSVFFASFALIIKILLTGWPFFSFASLDRVSLEQMMDPYFWVNSWPKWRGGRTSNRTKQSKTKNQKSEDGNWIPSELTEKGRPKEFNKSLGSTNIKNFHWQLSWVNLCV